MKRKRVRLGFMVMAVLGLGLALSACGEADLADVEVTFNLGDEVNLTATAGLYIYQVDPNDSDEYLDNKDRLEEVKDPKVQGTLTNNSGCAATFSVYFSYSLSATLPGDAVKVAETSLPGPAGYQAEINPSQVLTAAGESTINSYMEDGDAFYVYLVAQGQGCSDLDVTVLNPRIQVTLVYDLFS